MLVIFASGVYNFDGGFVMFWIVFFFGHFQKRQPVLFF